MADDLITTRFSLHFHHIQRPDLRATQAWIHEGDCTISGAHCVRAPAGGGFAMCSGADEFRKATGRKIALLRAMQAAGLSKSTRTFVWQQYFRGAKR